MTLWLAGQEMVDGFTLSPTGRRSGKSGRCQPMAARPSRLPRMAGTSALESLDGKFLYFSKDLWGTSIWRIPAGGGEETNIVKSAAGFAVASKGIYFIAPHSDGSSAVQFHSFATGKVTTIAAIHRPVHWGLSVSPDERYVLYTQVDQSIGDLMLVENFR